jgi:hypothetical protein
MFFTVVYNSIVHVNLFDSLTGQPLNDVVVNIVSKKDTIQTISKDGVASFDEYHLPLDERVMLTIDDSAFEPFF